MADYINKACLFCKTEFRTKDKRKKYCNDKCRMNRFKTIHPNYFKVKKLAKKHTDFIK